MRHVQPGARCSRSTHERQRIWRPRVPALVLRKRLGWLVALDPSVLYERMSGKGDCGCLQGPHTGGVCGWAREGGGRPLLRVQEVVAALYRCWASALGVGGSPRRPYEALWEPLSVVVEGDAPEARLGPAEGAAVLLPDVIRDWVDWEVELAFMRSFYPGAEPLAGLSFELTLSATPSQWLFRASV